MNSCVPIWPKFSFRCRYMSPPPTTNAFSSSSFSLPCVNSAADTKGKSLCVNMCVYDCLSGCIAYVLEMNTVLRPPPLPQPPTILFRSTCPLIGLLLFFHLFLLKCPSTTSVSCAARTTCKGWSQTLRRQASTDQEGSSPNTAPYEATVLARIQSISINHLTCTPCSCT
jgi:hypothetical protein